MTAMERLNYAYDLLASKKHMPELVIEDDIDVCRNAMAAAELENEHMRALLRQVKDKTTRTIGCDPMLVLYEIDLLIHQSGIDLGGGVG